MKILSIETSCDETAVSIVEAHGDFPNATYTILGDALFSQIDIHKEYGGVFPALAKREHIKTLIPMAKKALSSASLYKEVCSELPQRKNEQLYELLNREEGFADALLNFFESTEKPDIDLIAVTAGPGLEPTLWVGINFAKALSIAWDISVVGVNHMEGHMLASVFDGTRIKEVHFPSLSLLISGGHTELIVGEKWGSYARVGETRDDAIGEAFDKVARMLGLPYPGGPEISKLAYEARSQGLLYTDHFKSTLTRPMLSTDNLDFSFSGIKTAVRYSIENKKLTDEVKMVVAMEFEDAVTDVLIHKVKKALNETSAQSFILGGGVSANSNIREHLEKELYKEFPETKLFFPEKKLSTDNSIMIALAGHANRTKAMISEIALTEINADGNLSITD